MSKKALYTWTWEEGGYNQHYANTKKEALAYANSMSLTVNPKSFKRCNEAQAKAYWDNFPVFD